MIRAAGLCLLLLACSKPPAEPAEPRQTSVFPGPTAPALPAGEKVGSSDEIRGEWRIAGVAGQSVDQSEAITASILAEEIHAVAGCVRWNWRYQVSDGALSIERRPSASPTCLRPLTPIERRFETAMLRSTFAVRRPDGSLVLAGASVEVVLFTQ